MQKGSSTELGAYNRSMRWYQPVPALSWPVVSAVLVEWRVLGYALVGDGVQLFRAEQKKLRLVLSFFMTVHKVANGSLLHCGNYFFCCFII